MTGPSLYMSTDLEMTTAQALKATRGQRNVDF